MPDTADKPKIFVAPQASPLSGILSFFLRAAKIVVPVVIIGLLGVGAYSLFKPDPVKRARIDKIKQELIEKGIEPQTAQQKAATQVAAEDAAAERKRSYIETKVKELVAAGTEEKIARMLAETTYDNLEAFREREERQRKSDAALKEHLKVIDSVGNEIDQSEQNRRIRELENELRKMKQK